MDFIYVFLVGNKWDDGVIFLDKTRAINESICYPENRVEIFAKNDDDSYMPTYTYYKNGLYIIRSIFEDV